MQDAPALSPITAASCSGADLAGVPQAMTLDVYSGLFDDDLNALADGLDEAAVRARADLLRTSGRDEIVQIKPTSR